MRAWQRLAPSGPAIEFLLIGTQMYPTEKSLYKETLNGQ